MRSAHLLKKWCHTRYIRFSWSAECDAPQRRRLNIFATSRLRSVIDNFGFHDSHKVTTVDRFSTAKKRSIIVRLLSGNSLTFYSNSYVAYSLLLNYLSLRVVKFLKLRLLSTNRPQNSNQLLTHEGMQLKEQRCSRVFMLREKWLAITRRSVSKYSV